MNSSEEALQARQRVSDLQHTIKNLNHHDYHKLLEVMVLQMAFALTDDQWDDATSRALKEIF